MIEIKREKEPELFALIDDVVNEVQTQHPKKVFLSSDVNAFVNYNSSFWSMFFPVKKNLTIGLGLINTTTVSELKAILAHEFGHFSQKTMKVGSFVNQANKIIYDMLYNNKSIDKIGEGYIEITRDNEEKLKLNKIEANEAIYHNIERKDGTIYFNFSEEIRYKNM